MTTYLVKIKVAIPNLVYKYPLRSAYFGAFLVIFSDDGWLLFPFLQYIVISKRILILRKCLQVLGLMTPENQNDFFRMVSMHYS